MRRARAEHQEPERREDGSASGLRTGDAAADVRRRERVQRAAASCDHVGQATASETRASPIGVINKHAASAQERERAVYVGRGSALGNPFKVRRTASGPGHGPYERGQTLGPYERHLRERIRAKDPAICDALNGIYQEARRAQQEGGGRAPHVLLRAVWTADGPALPYRSDQADRRRAPRRPERAAQPTVPVTGGPEHPEPPPGPCVN